MRFQISLKQFQKIYQLALIVSNSFVAKENKDHLYVKCNNDQLVFWGSDGLLVVKLTLFNGQEVKLLEEGVIFVNAKLVTNVYETLHQKKVTELIEVFTVENNSFNITCQNYKCHNIPFGQQPFVNQTDFAIDNNYQEIEISLPLLQTIYERFKDFVKKSVQQGQEQVNNAIYGINLKATNRQLQVASTDAYFVVYGIFSEYQGQDFEINIFPDTLSKIITLFKGDLAIKLLISPNNIIIKNQQLSVKARLINGKYPSFIHWFTTENKHKITITTKSELIHKMQGLFVDPQQKYRIVNFEVIGESLKISNKDFTSFQVEDYLTITNNHNTTFYLALDYERLIHLLKKIKDEIITIEFINNNKPVIIRQTTKELNYQQIIIPSRIY